VSDLISSIDRAAPADGRAGGHPTAMSCNNVRAGFEVSTSSYHGGRQTIMDPFHRSFFFHVFFCFAMLHSSLFETSLIFQSSKGRWYTLRDYFFLSDDKYGHLWIRARFISSPNQESQIG